MSDTVETTGTDARVYELAYLFVPTLTEEVVAGSFGTLKNLLTDSGAEMISEEMPKMMQLAYEMNRTIANKKTWFSDGYFGWIKFSIDPEKLPGIEEIMKRDETMLRYMIIKTVRENTLATKKPLGREYRRRTETKVEGDEPQPEMDKEEVDKQIDALVQE